VLDKFPWTVEGCEPGTFLLLATEAFFSFVVFDEPPIDVSGDADVGEFGVIKAFKKIAKPIFTHLVFTLI